jgi:hypothetical protein
MTSSQELDLAMRLGIDLVAIFLCAYAIYYRRYWRRDLLMAYTVFNVGLFAVVAVITVRPIGAAVGFGMFALLSIIRLRSEPFSNSEISYFFVSLVLGLVNALPLGHPGIVVGLNALVLLTVLVADHPRLLDDAARVVTQSQQVVLDTVHSDEAALRADLERRLGIEIQSLSVLETDFVREVTVVTVRHRGRAQAPSTGDPRALAPVNGNGNGNGHGNGHGHRNGNGNGNGNGALPAALYPPGR